MWAIIYSPLQLRMNSRNISNVFVCNRPSVQSWKLICRLLKLFRNFAPPPNTMLNCGPVINVVSNIVLGEGALLLFIVGPCTE